MAIVPSAASRRPIPTTRPSIGSWPGPRSRPIGTACATACASCGSRPGPMRRSTASPCGWRRPVPRSAGWCEATPDFAAEPGARPDRRRRRRVGRRAAAGGRARARRRPAPARGERLALDHARLLGPLGSIADAGRASRGPGRPRRRPARAARDRRDAGRPAAPGGAPGASSSTVDSAARRDTADRSICVPGGLELVALPPGTTATAEFGSATAFASAAAAAISRSTCRAAWAACWSTCATSRCGCPSAPTAAASCSPRGRRRVAEGADGYRHPGDGHRRSDGPPPVASAARPRARPVRRLIESPSMSCSRSARATGRWSMPATSVVVGAPIAERLRDPRLEDKIVAEHRGAAARRPVDANGRVAGCRRRLRPGPHGGELLFPWRDRWRVATGDSVDPLETPVAGIVREVRPGTSITVRAAGRGLRGVVALGGPTRGRLQPRQRAGRRAARRAASTSGSAGSILVVGARVDAETLTRARAMGIRGIVVAGLASKERRDFLASEARQRAALHRLPPFAVLVLDGAAPAAGRRPAHGAARRARRARGGDRRRPADAALRRARIVDCRAAARSGPRPCRGRWRAARGAGSGRPDRAGSRRRRTSRRRSCGSPTAARSPSRSATSSASSDDRR